MIFSHRLVGNFFHQSKIPVIDGKRDIEHQVKSLKEIEIERKIISVENVIK